MLSWLATRGVAYRFLHERTTLAQPSTAEVSAILYHDILNACLVYGREAALDTQLFFVCLFVSPVNYYPGNHDTILLFFFLE